MSHPPQWNDAQRERMRRFGVDCIADVHCHCLPGIDDGPATLSDSLALCRRLAEDGVTSVAATPHQLGSYLGDNGAAEIRERVAQLQAVLLREEIPLELAAGGDVRIDERLVSLLSEGEISTIADLGKHLLLELPHEWFVDPTATIGELASRGVQPILTHPERHRYLADKVDEIDRWIDAGVVVQVTAGSLLGDFGRSAQKLGWQLAEAGLVHLVASDAHDAVRRRPCLTPAVEELSARFGEPFARLVCGENPRRVWRGEFIEEAG
jgi:protein-tyrosine phosphatase